MLNLVQDAQPGKQIWWFHSARSRQMVWLVFLFVLLDSSKSLAVSWAAVHGNMCAPLVICSKNVLSIACGLVVALLLDGMPGLQLCLDIRRSLTVLPIAAAFCAAQIFALQACRVFDAGSLKVIAQVNLPLTTLLSWLVLGRRYSMGQWFSMALLFIGTMAFLQVRVLFFSPPHAEKAEELHGVPDKVRGMFCILSGIMLSCSASICAEIFLKKRYDLPFYIQKTNLMFGEAFAALVMVYFSSEGSARDMCSWEQVQDWRQLPVILVWFVHGWIAGLLVKRCSALAKNVSHVAAALMTYFWPFLMSTETEHCWTVTICALLVLVAVLVFATSPPPRKEGGKRTKTADAPGSGIARSSSEAAVSQLRERVTPGRELSGLEEHKRSGLPRMHSTGSRGELLLVVPSNVSKHRTPTVRFAQEGGSVPGNGKVTCCKALQRLCSPNSVGFLVVCFVLLDATKPILVTWAHQSKAPEERFINGTFVLVQTSLSLLVGLIIAVKPMVDLSEGLLPRIRVHEQWQQRLQRCLDWHSVVKQMPVAFCLCLSKLFLVMALERLDAGTVRVFGQASLPLVGVGSALFFRRRYTPQQWCSLGAISVALVAFYHVKAEVYMKHDALASPLGRRIEFIGVLMILTSIGFNCLGALLVEKFLKGHQGRLHEQKAHLLLGEIAVNALILMLLPLLFRDPAMRAIHSPWHRGLFAGWDHRVLICAIVWIPAGWTATTLVKRCSNLLKTVSQCTSSVLTYIFSMFPVTLVGPPLMPEPLSPPVAICRTSALVRSGRSCWPYPFFWQL
eukprot:TRINITY_DN15282_c0_g1_i1.p1 TRINITY_DN15282_c0_g1~~TRINITY_DN15282_c0_g1_i1.p1  ORF type:complete len:867 (+),score=139.01 TRINITY_DN15282_c0_g1_i1:233-2602(+)